MISQDLSPKQKLEVIRLLEERKRNTKENKLFSMFPDTGIYSRAGYPQHMKFFEAGAIHKERAFIAGNQVGKSTAGSFEVVLHLTGLYPDWWTGLRFTKPIKVWCAGIDNSWVRDVAQKHLFGEFFDLGTGMIPKSYIVGTPIMRAGIPQAIDYCYIKHISGGNSYIQLKAYEQGRAKFQGAVLDFIWLDEEPDDAGIYSECLTRTITTHGSIICTFTPLKSLSEVVLSFLPGGQMPEDGIVRPQDAP